MVNVYGSLITEKGNLRMTKGLAMLRHLLRDEIKRDILFLHTKLLIEFDAKSAGFGSGYILIGLITFA